MGDEADSEIVLGITIGNATDESASFVVDFPDPAGAHARMTWAGAAEDTVGGSFYYIDGGGAYAAGTGPLKGVQFLFDSGNIATGTFVLSGRRK